MGKVLIVDDDRDLRAILGDVLKEEGFSPVEASDGPGAIRAFKTELPDAVLLDLQMPRMSGMETLCELRRINPSVPVIILTAYSDIPSAVEAIRNGAYDFTAKPPEFERLVVTLKRAVEKRALEREKEETDAVLKLSLEHFLGKSRAIQTVISQIKQVAQTDFSLIIQGETGTGKSVVAATIHDMSKRREKPFVSVDIGLLPDTLVESELFGCKKGAFSGAERDRTGYFETAHTGTIFIDELENMSAHVQSKLLGFIERKMIYPLGSTSPVNIDVRIISATNSDIRQSIQRKEFREDLFFRLGEFIIDIPPLRERVEDIPFFARKFLHDAAAELDKQIREIDDEALSMLESYSWPGNLRELKNVMKKAALFAGSDTVGKECIEFLTGKCEKKSTSSCFLPLRESLREVEKKAIQEAMDMTENNKFRAAELLDISYKTLLEKLREYGIKA